MEKVICTNCREIISEGPGCKSSGIVTCDKCKKQIIWKCDGESIKYD